jgi:hypothetical protein
MTIWVPVAIFLLAKGMFWKGAFVLVWGALVVVGLIDSVARPYLIGRRLELPLFVLFFALLGGVIVWGAKGIIIGPILVGIAPVLLDIYRDRYSRSPEMKPEDHAVKVKIACSLLIVMSVLATATLLRAAPPETVPSDYGQDAAPLNRHEKSLERLMAGQRLDNEHTRLAQEEFRQGTIELSKDDEQHLRDVQQRRSVDNQVAAGKTQKTLAHRSYKETVKRYGSNDPRSIAAKESWEQSRQAMNPLLHRQRAINSQIYQGRLHVHNDKTVLSVQKRALDSDARYRASDDRRIQKEEQNIVDDRKATTQDIASSAP